MVVALGAADRQPHESRRDGLDSGNRQLIALGAVAEHGATGQKTEREEVIGPGFLARTMAGGRHLRANGGAVTGQLRADKLVVGQVVIERLEDPVAPQINARLRGHLLVHVGIA